MEATDRHQDEFLHSRVVTDELLRDQLMPRRSLVRDTPRLVSQGAPDL